MRVRAIPLLLFLASLSTGFASYAAQSIVQAAQPWETPARLRGRFSSMRGTIEIGNHGVTFTGAKKTLRWTFQDIQTFFIDSRSLKIKSYNSRGWRLPGEKVYHFDLSRRVPPEVAAALAARVRKPSRNGDPNPRSPALALIPARHAMLTGGSNGILRFKKRGIDYVTASPGDSRSWRWADIQTIARPSAYKFTLGGYLETYEFQLKQPMSQQLFDELWDGVYARGLQLSAKQ